MNLSGKAVQYWMQQESVPIERVLIVTDDLSIPFGKQRLRNKGSDGGHNGLKNIIAILGRSDFARLRFGIGNEFNKGQQVNYVLSEWEKSEQTLLDQRIEVAKDTIRAFAFLPVQQAMSDFNSICQTSTANNYRLFRITSVIEMRPLSSCRKLEIGMRDCSIVSRLRRVTISSSKLS